MPDSLVGLVGLVGQAAPMPDSLVGQAAAGFLFFSQVGNMKGPGHQGPARVVRVRTRAASVARFGYIHEAEERSKIIFFSDSMQGVIKKNYFFSFSPLFCKPQLLLLIWAASM